MSCVLFLDSNCTYAMYIVNHALVIILLPLNFEHNTVMHICTDYVVANYLAT